MLCFVVLSNILLLTSLIAILSQVFTKVRPLTFQLHLRLSTEAFHEGNAPGFVTVYYGSLVLDLKDSRLIIMIGYGSRSGGILVSVSQR